MFSIGEVKKKLPKDFIDNLYNSYGSVISDKILSGMADKRATTLRVNTIKYNIQDLMNYLKNINIKFDRVLWYKDALILKNANEKDIQDLDIYKDGKIYLQSLSSMVPPLVLQPKKNEKVLDLTAAPGSKTTQIAMMMNNNGFILANELDKIRCERLKYNIESQGITIAKVNNAYGETIGKNYPQFFDKVLIDAPCSGEGRFIAGDARTTQNWSLKLVKKLSSMQKKLLKSAIDATKEGGTIVYSTCTLNNEEDENIVNWAIENLNVELLEINIDIKDNISSKENKCLKILPTRTMEGFFIAKFKKS